MKTIIRERESRLEQVIFRQGSLIKCRTWPNRGNTRFPGVGDRWTTLKETAALEFQNACGISS